MAKYIQEFTTEAAYNTARENNYIEPWVSLTDSNGDINYNKNTNGREYIDFGLPSGTLWGDRFLGATNTVSTYPSFFAFGETETKDTYIADNYIYGSSSYSKYNRTDGLDRIEIQDDAANATWGGNWHIPTTAQIEELVNNCTIDYPNIRTVRFTSNLNGVTVTFARAGYKTSTDQDWGTSLWIPSSDTDLEHSDPPTWHIRSFGGLGGWIYQHRYTGFPIWPVC